MKITQESALGCDTIEDSERATNCIISALVVANHALAWLCHGELGLSLLYWVAYKFVCATRMSKNLSVRNKLKKSPVVGLFGSGTFIPGVPVKGGTFGLVHWKPLCFRVACICFWRWPRVVEHHECLLLYRNHPMLHHDHLFLLLGFCSVPHLLLWFYCLHEVWAVVFLKTFKFFAALIVFFKTKAIVITFPTIFTFVATNFVVSIGKNFF